VIAAQGIRIYQPPIDTDDEAAAENARVLLDAMPFSIIGSTEEVTTADGRVVKGREYLWGVAEGTFISLPARVKLRCHNPFLSRKRESLRFPEVEVLLDSHAYAGFDLYN
jgi:hypothetical protein